MKQYTEITGHQDHRQQGSGQQLDPSIACHSYCYAYAMHLNQGQEKYLKEKIFRFLRKIKFLMKNIFQSMGCRRYITLTNLFGQLLSPSKISAKFKILQFRMIPERLQIFNL